MSLAVGKLVDATLGESGNFRLATHAVSRATRAPSSSHDGTGLVRLSSAPFGCFPPVQYHTVLLAPACGIKRS